MIRPCPPTPERRVGSLEARRGLTTSRQLAPTTSTLHRSPPPPGAAPYDPATIPTRIYADMRTGSAHALVQARARPAASSSPTPSASALDLPRSPLQMSDELVSIVEALREHLPQARGPAPRSPPELARSSPEARPELALLPI